MTQEVLRVPLSIGEDGLHGGNNFAKTPPTALIQATNLTYENGFLQKEGGAAQYSAATGILPTTVAVLGGSDWHPDGATQRSVIFTATGTLRKDTGAGGYTATLVSGLTHAAVVPLFVEAGKEVAANDRKLICFSGENAPIVLAADGATASALSSPPADWSAANQPSWGVIHKDRLWAGGNANDPHRAYYSMTSGHELMSGGSISIYPGDGEKLVRSFSFKDFLICFKYPKGIYAINSSDPTISNWSVQKLNENVGCAGVMAACLIDDDILFMDPHGNLHLLSSVSELSFGTRNLSDEMQIGQFIRANVNLTRLWNARMVYYVAKREVHIALPSTGSTVNDARLVLDFNRQDKIRFRWSTRDQCEALWLARDSSNIDRPFVGDSTGHVWRLDQDDRTKAGGYRGTFQTPHTDLAYADPGLATKRKNGRFLELVLQETGNWDLSVDIYWDERYTQTLTFNLGGGTTGFPYTFPMVFSSEGRVVTRRRRLSGSGRRFSVVGRNDGASQDFKIAQLFLGFQPGSELLKG